MPLPTFTITQDIGPCIPALGPGADGETLGLGDLPNQFSTGGFNITFVPSDDFVGSFLIVGRNAVKDTVDNYVPLVPYPYRAFYLNGAVSDLSMQPGDGASLITGRSDILVPASGARIGIVVTCSAGTCLIAYQPVNGSTAP